MKLKKKGRFHVDDSIEGNRQQRVKVQTQLNMRRSIVRYMAFAEVNLKKRKGIKYWGGLQTRQLPKWARRLQGRSLRYSI